MSTEHTKTDHTKVTETHDLNTIIAHRIGADLAAIAASDLLDHVAWSEARAAYIMHYWSGAAAPLSRHAEAHLLWSDAALYARFICRQHEPLILNAAPQVDHKTIGLWERDVCEIFVAPSADAPEKYYEFEVAPTGEWLDLAIHYKRDTRETDWQYASGMTACAHITTDSFRVMMRVPWSAFGKDAAPRSGEKWRVNLFRCVGAGSERGYLAWRPTHTAQPSFHVPDSFGWLHFE